MALPAPMQGLRVADFTSIVAGPWATRLMADSGAEVIKVESPGDGDVLRFAAPLADGASRVFAQYNRGKRSIALDLKAPADLESARRLIDQADVVVENFRPGVMDRLGLGWAQASARNPRLIYCSISGFGQDGPLSGEAAYAPVLHAMTGFDHAMMAAQDQTGAPPAAGVMIADVVAAAYAFGAVQSALLRRERFGMGAFVDVSLIESMMSLVGIQYQEAQSAAPVRSTVFRPTRTADGWVIVPLVTPRNYAALFSVIGEPADPVPTSSGGLASRRAEIGARLAEWAAGRSSAECVAALNRAGVACGVHASPAEALDHPHLAARGAFGALRDADGGFRVLNPPFRLENTPREAAAFVPRLGEHTDEILAGLGAAELSTAKGT